MNFSTTTQVNTMYLETVVERVDALNKIAKRLGVAPITVSFGETVVYKKTDGRRYSLTDVTINGEYPQFKGWEFVTHLDHADKIVRGIGTNHAHLLGDTTCDHCNTNRGRSVTYVITKDGQEKRVGGSCLKYYLPTKGINSLTTFYVSMSELFDEDSMSGGKVSIPTSDALLYTMLYVNGKGAYSKTETRWFVSQALSGSVNKEFLDLKNQCLEETTFAACEEDADKILAWAETIESSNDYMNNVKSALSCPFVGRNLGFICSSVVPYAKAMDLIKEKEAKADLPESEFVGTVKKRENFTVTLERVITVDGHYGTTFIHHFRDANNNMIIWFSSNGRLRDADNERVENGATVTIKATVKAHNTYKEEKQTIISRAVSVA